MDLALPQVGTLAAFGLYLVRTSALVLGAPLLGDGAGFTGYRIALVFGVAFALYAATGTPMADDVPAIEYGLFCLREVLMGVFLAFIAHLVVLAVRVCGELIGHEMAFTMAAVVDPATGLRTPLITRFYEVLFFLGLLAVDGHHWLLRALGESFGRAPVGALDVAAGGPEMLQTFLTQMFQAGVVFAAPVMVLLVLVSLLIGLLARVVPQLNVLEVGFTLRIAVALLAMLLFAPLVAPAMDGLFGSLMTGLDAGLDVIGG